MESVSPRPVEDPQSRIDVRDSVTLGDVFGLVLRHWLVAGTVFVLAVFATAFFTFKQTPIFESTSILLVKFGRELIYRPEVGNPAPLVNRDREAAINAEVQIFRSHGLAQIVVDSLGPGNLYPELVQEGTSPASLLNSAVNRFRSSLVVEPVIEAAVIRVSFRHPDPQMASRAVNLAVDHFKEKHLEAFSDPKTTAFLQNKVDNFRQMLDEAENTIKAFEMEHRPMLDRGEVLLRQREDLEASLTGDENEIAGLRMRLAYLNQEKEETAADPSLSDTHESATISQARANLLELQLEEQRLLASYKTNRKAADVRKQIELVEEFLVEQEARAGKGKFHENLEMEIINTRAKLISMEAQSTRLRGQLSQLNSQLAKVPLLELEYRAMIRERDNHEQNYKNYLKKLEESRISDEMDLHKLANISVIQEGITPVTPIKPRKKLNLAIGALLGAMAGLGCAYVVESVRGGKRRSEIAVAKLR